MQTDRMDDLEQLRRLIGPRADHWTIAQLEPIIIPLRSKRPCNLGSFGSLQVLVGGAEAN